MKLVNGWWCPDYDDNMGQNITEPEFAGRKTYQFYAIANSFPHLKNFRTALDIGAHVGLWSYPLSRCFRNVVAFEPVPEHAACFTRNMDGIRNARLIEVGLADKDAEVSFALKAPWSLKARVYTDEKLPTVKSVVKRLDGYNISDAIDFVKLDCEGYEVFALKGGEETIRKNKPFVIVEQKPGNTKRYGISDTAAVELLKGWGASVRWEFGGDYYMSW
jgi:FkbM family methyltransferase